MNVKYNVRDLRMLSTEELNAVSYRSKSLYGIVGTAALGSFGFGFNIAALNSTWNIFAQETEQCGNNFIFDCDTANDRKRIVSVAIFLMAFLGATMAGKLLTFSRRLLLICLNVIFIVGCVLSGLAPSSESGFWLMLVGRIIAGFGVGLSTVIVPTYIAEYSPAVARGAMGCIHQIGIVLGIVVSIGVCVPMTQPDKSHPEAPNDFNSMYWRIVFFIGSLPALLSILGFLFIYTCDVPVYSLNVQKDEQAALDGLRSIYSEENAAVILNHMKASADSSSNDHNNSYANKSLLTLLKNPVDRRPLLIGIGLSILQQVSCINVICTKSNDLLQAAGIRPEYLTLGSFGIQILNLTGTFITILFSDKFGRKPLLLLGAALQCVAMAPTGMGYIFLKSDNPALSYMALGSLGFYVFSMSIAMCPLVWVYLGEIYSPSAKNTAVSVASGLNWVGCLVVVAVFADVPNIVLYNFALVVSIATVLFVGMFVRETSGLSKSPFYNEEYQDSTEKELLA